MKPTYHIVSHSHWDREWYFPYERFRAMLVDMIEDLLEIFKSDARFKSYTLDGQMAAVLDYLEIRPDRKDEICQLVREKKLFIGPWYILNDEFLSSGESQIRNLLFGFRFGNELGGVMPIGYIPDQFGHIAQMPQLLLGFGIDTAMIYRGFGGEPGQEFSEYWWKSPNGSQVLMHHLPKDGYSAGYFASRDEAVIREKFNRLKRELDARATTSQRLFFNGGDHHWPDADVTTAIEVLSRSEDATILHSNFVDYVKALRNEITDRTPLKILDGETRFGFRHAFAVLGGVFSSRMYLKQMNAACQTLLERSLEPLNVVGMMAGMRSRTPQIEQAWKYLIQNQDHDAICGTSVDEVHQEMIVRYKKVRQIAAHVQTECLAQLWPYDETSHKDDRFLLFFNPSPFVRTEVVEAAVEFYLQDVVVGLNPEVKVAGKLPPVQGFKLIDNRGNEIPYQIMKREETFGLTYSKHDYPHQTLVDRFTVLVSAKQLPSFGWRGLSVVRTDETPSYSNTLTVTETSLENEWLKVEVQSDGSLLVHDKETGLQYSNLNIFEDSGDVGDEYNYSYPEKDEWYYSHQLSPKVSVVERGPLRAAIEIECSMNVPESASLDERSRSTKKRELTISSLVALTADSRHLEIKTTVHNAIKDHRLRVLFRTGINTSESYAESPFAVVKREHREYDVTQFSIEHPAMVAPMQRFVTIRDEKQAFTLLTKGLPEYELKLQDRGTLALTLLRSVGKLAGRDLITRPGGAAGWWNETPDAQCLGTHTFEYAIVVTDSSEEMWTTILKEAELFSVPPIVAARKNEQHMLEQSFLSVTPAEVQFSALKESEDGNGIVLRLSNPVDKVIRTTARFYFPVTKISRAMLNETITGDLDVREGAVQISIQPYEIVTVYISCPTLKRV
ncbi:MAG: glycoside hydrolase family 38 C-terminal domain-containing protein [bacterium]